MPNLFSFQQGTESRVRSTSDTDSPLLGRFRVLPSTAFGRHRRSVGELFSNFQRQSISYGTISDREDGGEAESSSSEELFKGLRTGLKDLLLEPKRAAV